MSILIISCSLNPNSKSRALAQAVAQHFDGLHVDHQVVDTQDLQLPLCDGGASYGHEGVAKLGALVEAASSIVFAVPIYNYTVNSVAKSVIEHCGRAMTDKPVGFVCAAGGQGSYMAVMSLANQLMLDFRCIVLPRFVYATGDAFDDNLMVTDPAILERLQTFSEHFNSFTKKLS